jgi:2-polyprenyl-3-methyl-5-hydroxy-6-metoxy-1,4-benzoquinol methylase
MSFCIIDGYKIRESNEFLDASNSTDEFQNEVYLYAKHLMAEKKFKSVADVGCGSAFKLNKYFKNYYTIGYDLEPTVVKLKKKFPEGNWVVSDFNSEPKEVDLVICADVIEHVINPDNLLLFIKKMKPSNVVISTPDRDILHKKLGRDYYGPPKNIHHVREWTFNEFHNYISNFFDVVDHITIPKEYNQLISCV